MSLLDRCFEGSGEIPKRLIKVHESVEKAEAHLEKANRNLLAATKMNENKFFDWAITCSYYAMYHATMASLWLIGLDARSHECAIAAFEIFYVQERKAFPEYAEYLKKAKKLSKTYSDSLEYAKTERIKASYGLGEISSEEANKVLKDSRDFITEITKIVFEKKGFDYIKARK